MGARTTQVKVDAWGKGKNDSLAQILKNQGYSSTEIYQKNSDGKSMLDQIASVNKLKNPNIINARVTLKILSKTEGLSSVSGPRETRYEHASLNYSTETNNGFYGEYTSEKKDSVDYSRSSMRSSDGSGRTEVFSDAGKNHSKTEIYDWDQDRSNLHLVSDRQSVTVINKANKEGEDVNTTVDISEKSRDGFFENTARTVAESLGLQDKEAPKSIGRGDAFRVSIQQDDNGARVSNRIDGKEHELLRTAGETDDGIIERAGELLDNNVKMAKNVWNWLTD